MYRAQDLMWLNKDSHDCSEAGYGVTGAQDAAERSYGDQPSGEPLCLAHLNNASTEAYSIR